MQNIETQMANAIRALTMDAVQKANSGHPGMPMGMADVATVLFNRFINIDPSMDKWADRDRFVLSAGHGSMLLYAIHHLLGYDDMDIEQIKNFRQMGYRTAGHPEYGHAKGIETTTGPLGQGITTAVGMALAERMQNARFGNDMVDHYTYVIAGDGCLMEGISHEAIDLAGHLALSKLIVFWDDNSITIDGSTNVSTSTNQLARFEAAGWQVVSCDGHNQEEIANAIKQSHQDKSRPTLIACKTIIGFGAPNKQNSSAVHGAPLGAEEIIAARKALDWHHDAFEVPNDIYNAWHEIAKRGKIKREQWEKQAKASPKAKEFFASNDNSTRAGLSAAMAEYKEELFASAPKVATRKASQMALEIINKTISNTVGGSADLTGSNLTLTSNMSAISKDNYGGNYIYYGVREHAMTAIMNGLALHGGFIPYGGTFLAFVDYCKSSIRLSALMGVPLTYVMTHDSIGLGEDGPTHQPIEQVANLRSIPNLNVFRPADVIETAEAWELSIMSDNTPSVLCLSRQGLPTVRTKNDNENKSAKGAYILQEADGERDVTLIATGSEVEIALNAAKILSDEGYKVAVVSAPCFELFEKQDISYRKAVLGNAPRVGIEALIKQGWGELLGDNSAFIGMKGFGASAPADELYVKFKITPKDTAQAARNLIAKT